MPPDDPTAPFRGGNGPISTARALWGAALLCVFGIVAMLAGVAMAAEPEGRVAIIYPPGTTQGQALTRLTQAGGRLVRFGNRSWIVVAAPASPAEAAGTQLAERARAGGALVVVNPVIVGGCGDQSPSKRQIVL